MKKFLSVCLVLVMLFAYAVPMAAEKDTSELEQVLSLVRARIGSTEQYEEFHSSVDTYRGRTVYMFNWETNTDENYAQMEVSTTPSGIIESYYTYTRTEEKESGKPSIHRPSKEEALVAAKGLIHRLNPALESKLTIENDRETESLFDDGFSFRLQRYENGIPVQGNTGYARVSRDLTTLQSFNLTWNENLTFDDEKSAISLETAQESYKEKLGMYLHYVSDYENGEQIVVPVYSLNKTGNVYIHALTGETVSPILRSSNVQFNAAMKEEMATDSAAGALRQDFSEAELKNIQEVSGLISETDMEETLRGIETLGIGKSYIKNSHALNHNGKDEYFYRFSFSSKEPTGEINVTVNAKTGALMNYYRYANDYNKEDTVTAEQTKALAQEAAKALTDERFSEYQLTETQEGASYVRHANGIPFEENSIHVGINKKDGKLDRYTISYTDVEFPSLDGIVTMDEAANAMFDLGGYALVFIPALSDAEKTAADLGTLVYAFLDNTNPHIKAATGTLLYENEADVLPTYTDISGHYAEEAIRTLARFGVGFKEETLRPDDIITQKEFMALLMTVFGSYGGSVILSESMDYESYYRVAKNRSIVYSDEVAEDAPLTREKAAVFIVRSLGYGEVADLPGIYASPFVDVTENIGAISILYAMHIMNGDGMGCFYPYEEMTRAQALTLIYNYLAN